jgi:hypothetical protein
MPDARNKDRTIALDVGQDRPAPAPANIYGKRNPLPKNVAYRLNIVAGAKAPSIFQLREPMTVLGRGNQMADIDVGDESASRRHASIEYKDGAFHLSDMGSTNGTILNGKMVSSARLKEGDEIQIGTVVMRFERG